MSKENVVCATTQVMSHFIDFQGTLKGGFKIYIDIYMFQSKLSLLTFEKIQNIKIYF